MGLCTVLDDLRTIDEKTVTVPFRHLREILILHIVAAMGWSQLFALLVHQDLGVFVESSISQVVMVWRGHHQLVVANTLRGMGEELVGKLVVKLHLLLPLQVSLMVEGQQHLTEEVVAIENGIGVWIAAIIAVIAIAHTGLSMV